MNELPLNQIICGDSLTELKRFTSESIDCCITSPPYWGLRDYGVDGQLGLEKTPQEYLAKMLEITAELKRVLKKTGQLWLNMGDCYGGNPTGSMPNPNKNFRSLRTQQAQMQSQEANKKSVNKTDFAKSLLMMPERLALKMIDEQGWILRNKIKWVKQIYLKKQNRTIGSVMPISVKDRFNESGEELYFFVKSKKYYSDLDSVRIPNQVLGVTDFRASGFVRTRELYPESKYRKFDYSPDCKQSNARQCPQFKATEEEIKKYQGKFAGMGKETEMFNSPRARTQRKIDQTAEFFKQKGSSENTNLPYRSNKVGDPRGNHEGGPGSWRDFKDENENFTHPQGKNLHFHL